MSADHDRLNDGPPPLAADLEFVVEPVAIAVPEATCRDCAGEFFEIPALLLRRLIHDAAAGLEAAAL